MSSINIDGENSNSTEKKSTTEPALAVYTGMTEVFEHTRRIISDMKQGEKIGMKDLIDKVSSQIATMSSSNVMNLVQMFCKQSKEVTVEVGRGGGVYKGGKLPRVDTRTRCPHCNQVVRMETKKSTETIVDNLVNEETNKFV
jgi:hypothetical protein